MSQEFISHLRNELLSFRNPAYALSGIILHITMKHSLSTAIMLLGALLANGQQEITITSKSGAATARCLSPSSGVISKIVDVTIDDSADRDTFHMSYEGFDGVVLHVAPYDTSFYVARNGTNYYLLESDEMPEDVWLDNLGCMYKNVRYPALAREKSIDGTVLIEIYLDQSGCIESAVALTSLGYGLEDSAIKAIRACDCKWVVATWGGILEPTVIRLPVGYRLR